MASNTIKGLTVEIGGDTTKLGKALKDIESESRSLSRELTDVNKLLKLDPKSTELMAQKQKLLSEAAAEAAKKLEVLKEAEKQVQEQFERGEASEEQLRALQREIVVTENKMVGYQKSADEAAKAVDRLAKTGSAMPIGDTVKKQTKELDALKEKYVDLVTIHGKESAEARAVAKEIEKLSGELKNNKEKLSEAEKEANKLDKTMEEAEESSGKFGETLKNSTVVALSAVVAAAAAAGAAAVALAKDIVSSYADYEQLVGGVETLFGAGGKSLEEYAKSVGKTTEEVKTEYRDMMVAQETVLNNADGAYKTAGLSANQYMETVTSFSASLIQSLGGDTQKAAEYADRAIRDMSDNANKMGTDMSSLQAAYGAFAKGNYTLLDNLKLGYGGTKEEMQRLIEHAASLTSIQEELGVTVDANSLSYANIVDALSVVQTEMGITGTTAKEAEHTISGSIGAFQASLENLKAGLGNADADVGKLAGNVVSTFSTVIDNVKPIVENLAQALPGALSAMVGAAVELLPSLLPAVVNIATSLISSLVTTLGTQLPELASTGGQIIGQILTGIQTYIPLMLEKGGELLAKLGDGIRMALPGLIDRGLDILMNLATTLYDGAPMLIESGFKLLSDLVAGIMSALPSLISKGPEIVSKFANIINDNFPTILKKGVELIGQIIKGIIQAIPTLIANIPKIITAIVDVWEAFNWLDLGKKAITLLKDGVIGMVGAVKNAGKSIMDACTNGMKNLGPKLVEIAKNGVSGLGSALRNGVSTVTSGAKSIFDGVVNTFKSLPSKMLSIGKDVVKGVWNGISEMTGWIVGKVKDFAGNILGGIKSALGIHSPSTRARDEVGKQVAIGTAIGIEENADAPVNAMEKMSDDMVATARGFNGLQVERSIQHNYSVTQAAMGGPAGLMEKLDKILGAIERGQVLVLDKKQLIGGTAGAYDNALGERRALIEMGAL